DGLGRELGRGGGGVADLVGDGGRGLVARAGEGGAERVAELGVGRPGGEPALEHQPIELELSAGCGEGPRGFARLGEAADRRAGERVREAAHDENHDREYGDDLSAHAALPSFVGEEPEAASTTPRAALS